MKRLKVVGVVLSVVIVFVKSVIVISMSGWSKNMPRSSIFFECFIVVGGALLMIALPLLVWAIVSHGAVWIWNFLFLI
jgi:hypothetical protein